MALTRSFLKGLDIPEEKIESIIEAHTETIDALKEQREAAQAELDGIKAELDGIKAKGDFEKKYNDEHAAFEKYKNEREASDTKNAKENAYKNLLMAAGISEKRIPAILKVTDFSAVELTKEGTIKDSEKLTEGIKTEWADFVTTEIKQGAKTPTPPGNAGGVAKTKDEILKIKDPAARQKAIAENHELFGF